WVSLSQTDPLPIAGAQATLKSHPRGEPWEPVGHPCGGCGRRVTARRGHRRPDAGKRLPRPGRAAPGRDSAAPAGGSAGDLGLAGNLSGRSPAAYSLSRTRARVPPAHQRLGAAKRAPASLVHRRPARGSFSDGPYWVTTRSTLTLTLRRAGVKTQIVPFVARAG